MKRITNVIMILAMMIGCHGLHAQAPNEQRTGVQFAWGASFTGQVDMSGNDMSSVGLDAYLGMKTAAVEVIGIGVGWNTPVSNSLRMMPVFGIVRTNFSTRPKLCFMDVRGGVSVNDDGFNDTKVGTYGSIGIGFNLATGHSFSSHLIFGYSYFGRKDREVDEIAYHLADLHMATLRLGISF